ncbi:unnamed protein product [Meganyctiphanes norvegica]|uniref:Uncharacterized protein n=1 Tax=Meganyctiphanes norvegica TaxID=48144 RepID=A0AAV2QVJ8_MEGNR
MCYILYICNLVCLFFSLVQSGSIHLKSCEETHENDCFVDRIEPQSRCEKYIWINDNVANFGFYIKPFTKELLSVSLWTRSSVSWEITRNLFNISINEAGINVWNKIMIKRVHRNNIYTYDLEVNGQSTSSNSEAIVVGDEIRVATSVASLWSQTCDPRRDEPPTQPTDPIQEWKTWQLATLAAVILVLILVAILLVVVLVLRYKKRNRDPDAIQPTYQHRRSRHVSENSLYESYGNHRTGITQMPAVGDESGITSVGQINQEVDSQSASVITRASKSTSQMRGSAHDSENSLYMGLN